MFGTYAHPSAFDSPSVRPPHEAGADGARCVFGHSWFVVSHTKSSRLFPHSVRDHGFPLDRWGDVIIHSEDEHPRNTINPVVSIGGNENEKNVITSVVRYSVRCVEAWSRAGFVRVKQALTQGGMALQASRCQVPAVGRSDFLLQARTTHVSAASTSRRTSRSRTVVRATVEAPAEEPKRAFVSRKSRTEGPPAGGAGETEKPRVPKREVTVQWADIMVGKSFKGVVVRLPVVYSLVAGILCQPPARFSPPGCASVHCHHLRRLHQHRRRD